MQKRGRELIFGQRRRPCRRKPTLPPPSRMHVWPAVGSGVGSPDSTGRGSNPAAYRSAGRVLLKSPSISLILQVGPPTIKDPCNPVLNFMF
jgi:hypothetical protein